MFRSEIYDINPDGIDYFVGDIHGCHALLLSTLAEKKFDSAKDRLFCVGDLIDRGPDSAKCVRLLEEPWFHSVLGNHDDMMLGGLSENLWDYNGGEWHHRESRSDLEQLAELIRTKCPRIITVDTLQGRIGVVHAESSKNWSDNGVRTKETNLWSRDKILSRNSGEVYGVEVVVVGHTPVENVLALGNVVYIDTGAYDTGIMPILSSNDIFAYLNALPW